METTPNTQNNNQRNIIIVIVVLALVTAVAIFFLLRLFRNNSNATADAMPPTTDFYIELDTLKLVNDDTVRIYDALQPLIDKLNEGQVDPPEGDFLGELDNQLEEELGLTFSENIQPWLGGSIGLGILEFNPEMIDSNEPPNIILAISVRDKGEADQFITDLTAALTENGDTVSEVEVDNQTVYIVDSQENDTQTAFTRSGDLMLVATDQTTLATALEAQDGDNLSSANAFKNGIDALPEGRFITTFISGDFFTAFYESVEGEVDVPTGFLNQLPYESISFGVSTSNEGVKIDVKSFLGEISDEQSAFFEAQQPGFDTAENLPANTFMLLSGQRLDLNWNIIQDSLGTTGEDLDESMALFADEFGFNPLTDLLPKLDGEYAVALYETNGGIISTLGEINLGALVMFESSDTSGLLDLTDGLNAGLETGLGFVAEGVESSATVYRLSSPAFNGEGIAYGISDQHVLLSTSENDINAALTPDSSLADSDLYKSTWNAFSNDTTPTLYLDLGQLLAFYQTVDPEVAEFVEVNPITAVALGSHFDDNVSTTTMIFFIP